MRKIHQSIAVLVLALVGLARCDQEEQRAVGDANPVRVAEMQQTHRDLWLEHITLVQHVVLYNATNNPAEQDAAENDVVANAKQIAIMVAPFYGEATSEKFFTLLVGYVAARLKNTPRPPWRWNSGMTSQTRMFSCGTMSESTINKLWDSKSSSCSESGDERRQLCYRI